MILLTRRGADILPSHAITPYGVLYGKHVAKIGALTIRIGFSAHYIIVIIIMNSKILVLNSKP